MTEKPLHNSPLGLMPRWRWEELRISQITLAVERFSAVGKSAPDEWISELRELNSNKLQRDTTTSGREPLP